MEREREVYGWEYSLWLLKQGGLRMFSLFEFAIGARLLVFIVFVACVYGGMPCLRIWNTAKQNSFGSLLL